MVRIFRSKLVVGLASLVLLGSVGYAARQSMVDLGNQSDALLTANLRGAAHLASAESALWRLRYDATDKSTLVSMVNGSIRAYEGHVTSTEERAALREWHASWAKDTTGPATMKSLARLTRVQRASGEKTLAGVAHARTSAERLLSAMLALSLVLGSTFVVLAARATSVPRLSAQGVR